MKGKGYGDDDIEARALSELSTRGRRGRVTRGQDEGWRSILADISPGFDQQMAALGGGQADQSGYTRPGEAGAVMAQVEDEDDDGM